MDADVRQAIEQLFVQYGRGVGSYVLTRVGSAELAEEITARVFLTVVRRFHQCRGSVVGWLWAIVRTEIGQHFRRRNRVVSLSDTLRDEMIDPAETPPQVAQRREMQLQMRTAMEELTDEEHQIVTMKFFLKVRNKDIAEALGISANNVGVKVHRSLRRLQELIEDVQEQEGIA